MARQPGARTQVALAFESIYGTAPASGYRRIPFARQTLGAERPLLSNELLGQGRDPLAPVLDALTVNGDLVVPVDVANFGLWLRAAFGDPATTGAGPYVHTYESGDWALPSMAIEVMMPQVPRFAMYTGLMLNTLSWSMQRSGLLTATVGLMGQGETLDTETNAVTPTELAFKRFGHFNGAILRNGSPLGSIVSADITYSNNLDMIEVIRSDGKVDGIDPSIAALSGNLVARFDSETLVNQAAAGDPCELAFTYTIDANQSLTFTAHAVYLPQPRIPTEGPGGVQAAFAWQAAKDTSPARMCTAVLTNSVTSYA